MCEMKDNCNFYLKMERKEFNRFKAMQHYPNPIKLSGAKRAAKYLLTQKYTGSY